MSDATDSRRAGRAGRLLAWGVAVVLILGVGLEGLGRTPGWALWRADPVFLSSCDIWGANVLVNVEQLRDHCRAAFAAQQMRGQDLAAGTAPSPGSACPEEVLERATALDRFAASCLVVARAERERYARLPEDRERLLGLLFPLSGPNALAASPGAGR